MYVYESPHEYYDMKSQGRDEHWTHLMIWFCCCPWQHLSFGGDIFEIREMMPGCPDAFCIFFFLVNQRRTAQLPGIIIDVGEQQWMSRIANYVYSGIEQRGGGASKSKCWCWVLWRRKVDDFVTEHLCITEGREWFTGMLMGHLH